MFLKQSSIMTDYKFPQWCCWGFRSPWGWRFFCNTL